MSEPSTRAHRVRAGTAVGDALLTALELFAAGDVNQAGASYENAIELAAADDTSLAAALMADHVVELISRERFTMAADRARHHARTAADHGEADASIHLRLLGAEASACCGEWSACAAELEAVEQQAATAPTPVSTVDAATVMRLQGLLAEREGRLHDARRLLARAREVTTEDAMVDEIEWDLLRLDLDAGTSRLVDPTPVEPGSVSELLLVCRALQSAGRYERAALLLQKRARIVHEPALRYALLHHLVVARLRLRDLEAAEDLIPQLEASAEQAPHIADAAARQRLTSLARRTPAYDSGSNFAGHVHAARLALDDRNGGAATWHLQAARSAVNTRRQEAQWELLAAEVALARAQSFDVTATHLRRADELATATGQLAVRIEAMRLLGTAFEKLVQDRDAAMRCWEAAQHGDEHIADQQETDATRVRYLDATPDLDDEIIRHAHGRHRERPDDRSAAAIVMAMEAARGRSLARGLPSPDGSIFESAPSTSALDGALRWLRRLASQLPRRQVVWLLHPAPDRVYHALLDRRQIHILTTPVARGELHAAVDALAAWRAEGRRPEDEARSDPNSLPGALAHVAQILQLDALLAAMPAHARRVAIVAGDFLADVPFGALPVVPSGRPLVARLAISDLPSLSMFEPLRRRSRHQRGDACLRVQPPSGWSTTSTKTADTLSGADASVGRLREALATARCGLMRFDCHGRHVSDAPDRSVLALAESVLTAGELSRLDLSACGTLVLGACESGVAQRSRRDEPLGFVRAGLLAGTSAVVAARWVVDDTATVAILDAFQRHLRVLPRDVALQRAQLDYLRRATSYRHLPHPTHPVWWSCWTLYGDAGRQTSAGPFRRGVRRILAPTTSGGR